MIKRLWKLGHPAKSWCCPSWVFAGVIVAFGLGHPVVAADVSPGQPSNELTVIIYKIDGSIARSMVEDLLRFLDGKHFDHGSIFGRRAVVTLNSTGGDFGAGLALAELFKSRGIETMVPAGASCLGPCAIAFLGGSVESDEGAMSVSRTLAVGGRLGFHAPALELPDGVLTSAVAQSAYETALSQIVGLAESGETLALRARLFPALLITGVGNFKEIESVNDLGEFEIATSHLATPSDLTASMAINLCRNAYSWSEDPQLAVDSASAQSSRKISSFKLTANDPFGDDAGTIRTVVPLAADGEGNAYYCLVDHAKLPDGLKVLCRGFILAGDQQHAIERARSLDPDIAGSVELDCNLPGPIDSIDLDGFGAVLNFPPVYVFVPAATAIRSIAAAVEKYQKEERPIVQDR